MIGATPSRMRRLRRIFMPSAALGRYVGAIYASQFITLLIMLVAILQTLDLLNQSDNIMRAEGATRASLVQYVQWRFPELVSQFAPFAALLATLFTLAGLNQSSEITVMRAAGLSASQVIVPILATSLVMGVLQFIFHETVTIDSARHLADWRRTGYQPDPPPPTEGRQNIWLNDGTRVVEAETARRLPDQVLLDKVTIFERADDGDLTRSVSADLAILDKGIWTLYGARDFDFISHKRERLGTITYPLTLPVERLFANLDHPEHASITTLRQSIDVLAKVGMETYTLETTFYHRFAMALSGFIMPLLGCFVAYGVPRGGARVGRIVMGMALGFSYFVFDNYMVAMGGLGVVPAFLASTAAPGLYLLAGFSILSQLE